MRRNLMSCVLSLVMLGGLTPLVLADEAVPSEEVEQLIQRGRADTLERRLNGGRNATEYGWLAHTYTVAARGEQKDRAERQRLYEKADAFWAQRIESLPQANLRQLSRSVTLAEAHLKRAQLLALTWPEREYDDFRVTSGIRGDRAWLAEKFAAAVTACREAYQLANELYRQREQREDEFYTAGVYDRVASLRLDSVLVRAWARYRLGLVSTEAAVKREAFTRAEEDFRNLIEFGASGATVYQCYLGQGLALRELGQYKKADEILKRVEDDSGSSPALRVRIQYERALVKLGEGHWDSARARLKPLAETDPRSLAAELKAARFYYNLARIAFARSFLLEATAQAEKARGDRSERALIQLARETRERGLTEFRKLGRQGKAWEAIAQLFIIDSVDRLANPDTLSPTAILYAAREMRVNNPDKARRWLESAIARRRIEPDLLAELIFELGVVEHELRHYRLAAKAFTRVAGEFRSDIKAPQAAGHALRLWQHATDESKAAEDYEALAQAARVILESFPDHELLDEARWTLPRALAAAGDYEAAARSFAAIQPGAKHWEQAQQQAALLRRRVVESQRGSLSAEAFRAAAIEVSAGLAQYADAAFARAATLSSQRREEVRIWSAEARLRGAELLVAADVGAYEPALGMLSDFETSYPGSDLLGAVLGVRIRALNGLRRFEEAGEMVSRFLNQTAPEKVGGVLAALAAGMRTEVERLADQGQVDAARELARGALPTFEQLAKWADNEGRAEFKSAVGVSLARMNYLAGEFDTAEQMVRQWLNASPQKGHLMVLLAQVLTARLEDSAEPAAVAAALEAWDTLLANPNLREQAAAVYWEALYHRMALMLRSGSGREVYDAIGQQQIWHPEMGGPKWQPKFVQLRAEAAKAAGIDPEATSIAAPPSSANQPSETDNEAS